MCCSQVCVWSLSWSCFGTMCLSTLCYSTLSQHVDKPSLVTRGMSNVGLHDCKACCINRECRGQTALERHWLPCLHWAHHEWRKAVALTLLQVMVGRKCWDVQAWGLEQCTPSGGGQPICWQRGHLVCREGESWTLRVQRNGMPASFASPVCVCLSFPTQGLAAGRSANGFGKLGLVSLAPVRG